MRPQKDTRGTKKSCRLVIAYSICAFCASSWLLLLEILARRLSEVSAQNFVDGKSEGIYKDSECELPTGWM